MHWINDIIIFFMEHCKTIILKEAIMDNLHELKNHRVCASTSEENWLDAELESSNFKDKRLKDRFMSLTKQIWGNIGETIPFACQDWSNTKAAYRLLSNDKVNESDIFSGHFESTKNRFLSSSEPILVLHDTTEFSYQRAKQDKIGIINLRPKQNNLMGKQERRTTCGILMHSSLAITTSGLPLGIAAIKFWTRKKFKGTNALKKKINPTRIPIDKKESFRWIENIENSTNLLSVPERCIHIGDRESDIYELYSKAEQLNTKFVIRTCVDRLAIDGKKTITKVMDMTKVIGHHNININDKKGGTTGITLSIKYKKMRVLPPLYKQKEFQPLELTVIYAFEKNIPKDRERIFWKIITNIPINSIQDAIEKIEWYSQRWKIETFHKILKSGCKAEESKLRTAERLTKLISIFCILSWRILWITMLNRCYPSARCNLIITDVEKKIIDRVIPDTGCSPKKDTVEHYTIKIAKLGGYLARASDPPPGNNIMWRAIKKLNDIQIGFEIAMEVMGN